MRRLRLKRGLSQRQLGKAIGYTKGYISHLETGRMQMTPEAERRIHTFFESRAHPVVVHHYRAPDGTFTKRPGE